MVKKVSKFYLSIIEEAIMNSDYDGYRGGRIEIQRDGEDYHVGEGRFLIPEELCDKFRELLDFFESSKDIRIDLDTSNKRGTNK